MIYLLFSIACSDYKVVRQTITDSFVQPSRESGVDILWVVDDSASMFEEHDQLSAHADSFISYLTAVPVDFQLGIITTDVSVEFPGALLGTPLSAETPDLVSEFSNLIFTEEGSRDEKGFEAVLAALNPDGPNGSVLRQNADLEIVFFSDEDEQSDMTVNEFLNGVASLRSSSDIVVNAIVGDPPEGCASVYGAADVGEKYQKAQEKTNGARESICALDYDAMLQRIAVKVLGLETTFALSAAPDLSTLEVTEGEAYIHQRSRHGWRYDAGENTIIFDGYAVPYPSSEIIINYAEWIGPEDSFEEQVEE